MVAVILSYRTSTSIVNPESWAQLLHRERLMHRVRICFRKQSFRSTVFQSVPFSGAATVSRIFSADEVHSQSSSLARSMCCEADELEPDREADVANSSCGDGWAIKGCRSIDDAKNEDSRSSSSKVSDTFP